MSPHPLAARRRFAVDSATVLQGVAMTEDDIESLTELELAAVSEDRRFPLCF